MDSRLSMRRAGSVPQRKWGGHLGECELGRRLVHASEQGICAGVTLLSQYASYLANIKGMLKLGFVFKLNKIVF